MKKAISQNTNYSCPSVLANLDSSAEKYKILEKLKTIIPEAYFYWALAVGEKV